MHMRDFNDYLPKPQSTQGHYNIFSLGEGKLLEKGDIIIRLARTIFKISFFSLGYIIKGGVPISRRVF